MDWLSSVLPPRRRVSGTGCCDQLCQRQHRVPAEMVHCLRPRGGHWQLSKTAPLQVVQRLSLHHRGQAAGSRFWGLTGRGMGVRDGPGQYQVGKNRWKSCMLQRTIWQWAGVTVSWMLLLIAGKQDAGVTDWQVSRGTDG